MQHIPYVTVYIQWVDHNLSAQSLLTSLRNLNIFYKFTTSAG